MLSFISFIALTAALSLTFENVALASSRRSIENSYIVKLKDTANTTSHIESLPFLFSVQDPNSPVTHWWPDNFLKGYSGVFVGTALDAILASPDVEYVQKNNISTASDSQTRAPWNLRAISTRTPVRGKPRNAMIYTYSYTQPIGDGVDIYILDSGVYTEHNEFEGRATFGWAVPGYGKKDNTGHGTHVAGIVAGKTYGVAKNANIISVKITDADEIIPDDIVEGLNWVAANVRSTRKPSIVCMANSGPYNLATNQAATGLVNIGVTLVVSAGNRAEDSLNTSPATAKGVIVVGATDITNTMAPWSNFGPIIDVFAPGVGITSASPGARRRTRTLSGTSMAAAHVTGVAADILSKNPGMKPDAIRKMILNLATRNVISGLPPGTENLLVFKT